MIGNHTTNDDEPKKNIIRLDSVGYTIDTENMVIYLTRNERKEKRKQHIIPITDITDDWINELSDPDFDIAAEYIEIPFRCLRC